MNIQRIATHFAVFPLSLLVMLYFGYRILDVVLYSKVDGYMTMRYVDGSMETMNFTKCRLTHSSFGDMQMVVSDAQDRGMVFERTNQGKAVAVLVNAGKTNELLGGGKCRMPVSDLVLANFSLRPGLSSIQSWKGSAAGECDVENGNVEFSVNVHACR